MAPERRSERDFAALADAVGSDSPAALDDRSLVSLVARRDASALSVLYDRYSRPAFSLALRVLGDRAHAEDVVQEVFLAVWRDAERFDAARGGFSSYLLSMIHHKAVDVVRREEGLRRRRDRLEVLEVAEQTIQPVDDEVWTALRGESVRAALQQIPDVQRRALELAYYGGHTQREIAALTSTPLGTVKTRMLAGMKRLRDLLETSVTVDDGGRS